MIAAEDLRSQSAGMILCFMLSVFPCAQYKYSKILLQVMSFGNSEANYGGAISLALRKEVEKSQVRKHKQSGLAQNLSEREQNHE